MMDEQASGMMRWQPGSRLRWLPVAKFRKEYLSKASLPNADRETAAELKALRRMKKDCERLKIEKTFNYSTNTKGHPCKPTQRQ